METPFSDEYTRGLEEGLRHASPSHETRRLMTTIQETLSSIDKRLAVVETKQEATLEQARKTNGRVNALEMWRSAMAGAIAIITFIGIPNLVQVFASL